MNWIKIGQRVKELRGGYTLKEFGNKIRASPGFLSEVERGKHRPSVELLSRLAQFSGRPLSWILSGAEDERTEGRPQHVIAEERLSVVYGREPGEKLLGLVEALLRDRELYVKHDDLIAPVAEVIKHTGQMAREREAGEKRAKRKGRKSSA